MTLQHSISARFDFDLYVRMFGSLGGVVMMAFTTIVVEMIYKDQCDKAESPVGNLMECFSNYWTIFDL